MLIEAQLEAFFIFLMILPSTRVKKLHFKHQTNVDTKCGEAEGKLPAHVNTLLMVPESQKRIFCFFPRFFSCLLTVMSVKRHFTDAGEERGGQCAKCFLSDWKAFLWRINKIPAMLFLLLFLKVPDSRKKWVRTSLEMLACNNVWHFQKLRNLLYLFLFFFF